MKNWGLIALLALPTIVTSVPAAPAKKKVTAKVKWQTSYSGALAEAKRTGKPIFIDFYTTWCGPCKFLDEVTYKDAKFVAESRNWVMVKVDAEKNQNTIALAKKFKVEGYPTMVFLKPNGKETDRAVGGYPASMLVPKMEKAAEKALGGKSI